ncbi:MAG: hypothetical protein ACYS8X_02930 [Planctomycetota bacterium]|jgi:hypothetical protein
MIGWSDILTARPAIATLNAIDRFRAAQSWPGNGVSLLWLVLFAAGAGMVAALITAYVMRRRTAHLVDGAVFDAEAEHRGLSSDESRTLRRMAGLASVRRPTAIFTVPEAFARGESRLLAHRSFHTLSNPGKNHVRTQLRLLREKLGFNRNDLVGQDRPVLVEALAAGLRLEAVLPDAAEIIEVDIIAVAPTELIVRPTKWAPIAAGQQWQMRYAHGPMVWEFDATVLQDNGEQVVLHYDPHVRFINRRRFRRIEAVLPGLLANFSFVSEGQIAQPRFVPAVIVEFGGPGLLMVKTSFRCDVGDKVLIVVKFHPDHAVQAVAKVRRVATTPGGLKNIGLEMISLSERDIATLISETAQAGRLADGIDNESAPDATPAMAGMER